MAAEAATDCRWIESVVADGGGPFLVADLDSYRHWAGVHPDAEHGPFVVHYYGPLVASLPPRFQPSGADSWHQVSRQPDAESARDFLVGLRAAAEEVAPGLTTRHQQPMSPEEIEAKAALVLAAQGARFVAPLPEGVNPEAAVEDWISAWRDHTEQGVDLHTAQERVLHIGAEPDTDYRRACDGLYGDASAVTFGPDGANHGVVWDQEGSGVVSVARTGDGLLLLRTWVDEDEYEDLARAYAAGGHDEEDSGIETPFPTGRVVVAWSPARMADFGDYASVAAIEAVADRDEPVTFDVVTDADATGDAEWDEEGSEEVATVLRVTPGRYRVSCGAYGEEDGWSCRWARFTRVG